METSAMHSPLRLGAQYDLMHRHSHPPDPAEAVLYPATPDPNFLIDDLLDFSNGELCDESDDPWAEQIELKEANSSSGDAGIELQAERCLITEENQQQATTSGLCVPSDELADQLEWLSAFNEDNSYSGDRQLASLVSSGCIGDLHDGQEPTLARENKFQSPSPISVLEPSHGFISSSYCQPSSTTSSSNTHHVPSRARSKRARAGSRIWSLDSLMPTLFDTCLGGAAAQESSVFFGPTTELHHDPFAVPTKKAKKPPGLFKAISETPPRRCSHCLVTKTPQWRTGPNGPKTLCNACGVRYKSGRLVPEYRPAGSPTFVSEVHSNSHKRILEMRKIKEMEEHMAQQKEVDEEEESDCLSQSESCKEHTRKDEVFANGDDGNTFSWSEKDDASVSAYSEKEDPTGSVCDEKVSSARHVSCGHFTQAEIRLSNTI